MNPLHFISDILSTPLLERSPALYKARMGMLSGDKAANHTVDYIITRDSYNAIISLAPN